MNSNTKFDNLTIVEHGLILKNRKKREREISISQLDKIYIKVSKLKPVYELGFILFPFLLIFLSSQFVSFEKVILLSLSIVITVFVKINNYKRYTLIVCLKDGTVFRKKVSLKVKGEIISIISAVRKKQLNHFIKINAQYKLEPLEFCQNMAS